MEEYKGLSKKDCRKLSVKCIGFSVLGMLVLFITNYNPDLQSFGMPKLLFMGMMASAALVLLVGIAGLIISAKGDRRDV